jgi:hypothetical protein
MMYLLTPERHAQLVASLEATCGGRCNAEYNPCQAREAIAALRAQPVPETNFGNIRIPTDTMEQEFQNHYRRGFEAGKKAAQPDHSKLVKQAGRYEKLRKVNARQFTNLYFASIRNGKTFDKLVDELEAIGRQANGHRMRRHSTPLQRTKQ